MSAQQVIANTKPFLPVLEILDENGIRIYTYNHFTGLKQFTLVRAQFSPQYLGTAGIFQLKIRDTSGTMLSNVRRGTRVRFYVGVDNGTKTMLMLGMVLGAKVETVNSNLAYLHLRGIDWGSAILNNRVTNFYWKQRLLSTGQVDTSDNSTTVFQILKDMLTNPNCYPAGTTPAQQGVFVADSNIAVGSAIQLPAFTTSFEFLSDKVRQLGQLAINAFGYVDATQTFHFRRPAETDSGILLTDYDKDLTSYNYQVANPTKVGLISARTPSSLEFTIDDYKRRLFGIGSGIDTLESQNTDTTTYDDLTQWRAQKLWNPTVGSPQSIVNTKASLIGVYISKVGTPPLGDLKMRLMEDNGGQPTGSEVKEVKVPTEDISAGGASVVYFDFTGENLNSAKDHWIVLQSQGADPANNVRWHRQVANSGSVYTHASSPNGTSWTVSPAGQAGAYGYAYQYWYTRELASISEHLTDLPQAVMFEDVLRQPDITNNALMSQFLETAKESAFKEKWVYRCTVRSPTTLLQNGQKVRIRVVRNPLFNFDYPDWVVSDLEYIFESTPENQTGNFWFEAAFTRNDEP